MQQFIEQFVVGACRDEGLSGAPYRWLDAVATDRAAWEVDRLENGFGLRWRQGMLEASNVNAVASVVSLLTIQRRAEMLTQAMGAFHSNFDKVAANDLPHV